jgi:predicted metal-dependent phosphoesterase TrpH
MGKADLHIHTRVSDGMATVEETVAYVENETDLDVVAITDHEDVRASFLAREIAARRGYRVQVVPGAEITTLHGHVLALFVEEPLPSFRSVDKTIALIHRLGGLAVIPHPMSWLTRSVGQRPIERLVASEDPELRIDALEESQSPAGSLTRRKVSALNETRYHLPRVGNSDAHFLVHIGSSFTTFEGADAAALKAAIQAGQTAVKHGYFLPARELGLRAILHQTGRGLMATPRKMAARPFEARRSRA